MRKRSVRTTLSSLMYPISARSMRLFTGSCSLGLFRRSAPPATARGRTGDRFMSLCKSGQILNCCHPNALMTLAEYLVDYASEDTKRVGMELIQEELKKIPRDKVREIAAEHIKDICSSNRRDFRF